MRNYFLLLPMILLAGCSRNNPTEVSAAAPAPTYAPATAPAAAPAATDPPAGPGYSATAPPATEPVEPAAPPVAEPVEPAPPQPVEPGPPPNAPVEAVIPAGVPLRVRLDETLGTKHDRAGERFTASLANPVVVDNRIMLPAGTRFNGHLTESKPSGRMKGRAVLALRLDSFDFRGREYRVDAGSIVAVSGNHKRRNIAMIGGGAGTGAVIGAVAGGGVGAAIGAGAGAGAGTLGAFIKGRKQERIPAESAMTFSLRRPVPMM